jgi:hypothetical protein
MKKLLHLVLLGSILAGTLGGCYVRERPGAVYVRGPRVWVPAHYEGRYWVRAHWRVG